MPNTIPEKLWSLILADFITKLPLAQGYIMYGSYMDFPKASYQIEECSLQQE